MPVNKEITENDFENLLNDKLSIEYWELQLGIGLQYEFVEGDIKFYADYPKMGKKLWKAFKYELYEILCDRKSKEPNEWLNDLLSGDIRNLIVGIFSAITAKYEVSIGIALPLVALVTKTGVLNFCSNATKKPKSDVKEILKEKKPNKK